MKYVVHRYIVVRQPIAVEAESQLAAIDLADEAEVDLRACFDAEETVGYLVDEVGDSEYVHTRYFDKDRNPEQADLARVEKTRWLLLPSIGALFAGFFKRQTKGASCKSI